MVPKTLRAFLFLMALITAACGGIVPQDFDKGVSPPSKIPADPETAASALAIMSTRTVEQSNSPSKASEISGKSPPASHLTPAPLTTKAMDSCPMSMPNLDTSPDEYYISTELGYGNPEGTLFIGLWPGSKVLFFPDGPGQISSTGLRMKFWFYRTVPGEITFSGERLDATAPPLPEITLPGVDDGYDESGFHPAELVFPSEGCWQVTASVADQKMSFVTLVVKVPFETLTLENLPDGLRFLDTDISGLPHSTGISTGTPVTRMES